MKYKIQLSILKLTAMLAVIVTDFSSLAFSQHLVYQSVSIYDHTTSNVVVNGYPIANVNATRQPLITADLTPYLVQGTNEIVWKFTGQPNLDAPAQLRFRLERKIADVETVVEKFTIERMMERKDGGTAPDVVTQFDEVVLVKPSGGFMHELRSRVLPGRATRCLIDFITEESHLASLPADPGEMTARFALSDAPLTTLPWTGAPVVLTAEDETTIRNLVIAFRAAFVAKNTSLLADMQDLRIQRYATARGQAVEQFRVDLIESYQVLFGESPFVFDVFDGNALTLTSYPGVNLVQVLRDDQPPIRAAGQSGGKNATFKVPVFVSKIEGVWKIVD
jgi:hypothetical protein